MVETSQDLDNLDELLAAIDQCSPADEAEFAHEHINEARTYLLGAMPVEFAVSLELARETLARMNDSEPQRKAQKLLASLLKNGGS